MKSINRLLFALFVVFTSCKKDAKPIETVPDTEDSLVILTKAYYYYGDTTSIPLVDSFYYNANRQIEKVVGTQSNYADTTIYWLTYTNNGDLATVKGNGAFLSTKMEYSFFYDVKKMLDSIIILDRSWNNDSICTTFSYDANNYIKSYYSYFLKTHSGAYPTQIEGAPLSSGNYYRNGGKELDSLSSQLYDSGILSRKLFTHFNGTGTSQANIIDKSYLFILASRLDLYLSYNVNPFWYQYISPDAQMFKGGSYTSINLNPPYENNYHTFDSDVETDSEDRIRLITIKEGLPDRTVATVKLQYAKIPK